MTSDTGRVQGLQIHVADNNGVTVVTLVGELDASGSTRLRTTLRDLVRRQVPAICVNLHRLGFINSAGIATLIECLQGTRAYQGRFALAGMNQNVRDVFEVARLDMVFTLHPDEAAAVKAMSEA